MPARSSLPGCDFRPWDLLTARVVALASRNVDTFDADQGLPGFESKDSFEIRFLDGLHRVFAIAERI
jgi:hypothetical protein